jgi:stage II sporulation protein D
MRRRTFVTSSLAFAAVGLSVRSRAAFAGQSGDEFDPASATARGQALRVLLGRGDARAIDGSTFWFRGRRYRGTFSYAGGGGQVVSVVPLEQYLYSVVPREMPPSWPFAALAAQAIAARTYVLQRSNPRREYDVVPSEADQVYTGIDAENPAATSAVDRTAGAVLRFDGGFAQAVYSSCCGGHTESSADAWGGAPLSYLGGVICPYCTASPWYRWSRSFRARRLRAAFGAKIAALGPLQSISIAERDASGRARYVDIAGADGRFRSEGSAFRLAVGPRILPSLLLGSIAFAGDPAQAGARVEIEGGGLGHGVGLCQWGARGMAVAGATADTILNFYFPGTHVGDD